MGDERLLLDAKAELRVRRVGCALCRPVDIVTFRTVLFIITFGTALLPL